MNTIRHSNHNIYSLQLPWYIMVLSSQCDREYHSYNFNIHFEMKTCFSARANDKYLEILLHCIYLCPSFFNFVIFSSTCLMISINSSVSRHNRTVNWFHYFRKGYAILAGYKSCEAVTSWERRESAGSMKHIMFCK